MWAMIVKEFRQMRRDRRTLAMLIALPVLLLIVFGYAANFDVTSIDTVVVGPRAEAVAAHLPAPFTIRETLPEATRVDAVARLRDGREVVAIVADGKLPLFLMDGSELFASRTALTAIAKLTPRLQTAGFLPAGTTAQAAQVLFNPDLKTSVILIPALAGLILSFVGTMITSVGVVRERQEGTLDQLAVMPLKPRDVFVGKIAPYFMVACVDLMIVVIVGTVLFGVPFAGSVPVFALGALLFLLATLGIGVLISGVSQNQAQAMQLSLLIQLPQITLSGLVFPLASMPWAVRWISYVLPLSYFIQIARGVMVRGASIAALVQPFVFVTVLAVVVSVLALLRFRRDLAPRTARSEETAASVREQ
jgi:ABC-2 type transport system permease protein